MLVTGNAPSTTGVSDVRRTTEAGHDRAVAPRRRSVGSVGTLNPGSPEGCFVTVCGGLLQCPVMWVIDEISNAVDYGHPFFL